MNAKFNDSVKKDNCRKGNKRKKVQKDYGNNQKMAKRSRQSLGIDETRNSNRTGKGNYSSHVGDLDSNLYGGDNDFSWYNTLPELTSAAAQFPFSRPLGTSMTFGNDNSGDLSKSFDATGGYIPGIMAIHWNPTIGVSTSPISTVNVTAREIYSFVRHANSGSANYDAPDLFMYLLAMDSIYSEYTMAVRAYGFINMYTKENRYMPQQLLLAMGFDPDAVMKNAAQFRYYINQVAYKISSFGVPSFMSYYLRHMWMNGGVYTDKATAKAQTYVYVQDGHFVFNPLYPGIDNSDQTSLGANKWALQYVSVRDNPDFTPLTPDTWFSMMSNMINPLLANEEIGIMSGDILKAFGADNLFSVTPIPIDSVVVPSHNEEVLSQITNLTVVGAPLPQEAIGKKQVDLAYVSNDIIQVVRPNGEGYIYYNPGFLDASIGPSSSINKGLYAPLLNKCITSSSDHPEPAEIMVSTRLTNTPVKLTAVGNNNTLPLYTFSEDNSCATEVVSYVSIIQFAVDDKGQVVVNLNTGKIAGNGFDFSDANRWKAGAPLVLAALTKFDWAPTFPILYQDTKNGTQFAGYYQDTDNYTIMTGVDLHRLHEAALMSEFYIPQIASLSRKPISQK